MQPARRVRSQTGLLGGPGGCFANRQTGRDAWLRWHRALPLARAQTSYCPVADTPQLTLNVRLELAGKLLKMSPPGVNKFGHNPKAGHTATGEPLGEHAVTLQLDRPALGVSCAMALFAAVGPALLKVIV